MWTTVLVLAVALNFEPNRIGIAGFLLLRPHPIRQLLVFLGCSFLASATAGLIILFAVQRGSVLKGASSSAIVQIAVGTLALLVAAVLFTDISLPARRNRGPVASQAVPPGEPQSGLPLVDGFTKRAGRLTRRGSLWLPAVLGIGISLPSVDYVALLLLVAASGESPTAQVGALLTFLTVANIILLVPVVGYAIARQRTIRVLEGLRSWVLARRRRDYAILLAVVGALLVAVGFTRL